MKKFILLLLPLLAISFTSAYSSQEQKEAYERAYSKWITTQPFEKANLNWYITRQQLAKMLVRFYEARRWEIVYVSDPNVLMTFWRLNSILSKTSWMIKK